MILMYKFFKIPIYRRSYKKYCEEAEKDREKYIKSLEACWNKPYKSIPKDVRVHEEDERQWPPWEFNDIIGFVDIGMDPHDRLTGNIFLIRKFLPKNHHKNLYNKYHSPSKKQEIYYFCELDPHKVDWHNNSSCIEGINQLLSEAERIIKELSQTRKHKWVLQRFLFSLDCINFVKMASEIHTNFPNKKCVTGQST